MTRNKRIFYHILTNTLIAGVTNSFVWFVVTFWVYLETQSLIATSFVGGIFAVLTALTSLFFGAIVDHNKKKHVMMYSSVASLVAYTIGALLYGFFLHNTTIDVGSIAVWLFIFVLMIGFIIGNLRSIALTTCVTILIPEKEHDKANGLVGMVNGAAFAITSIFSGVVIGFLGMEWAIFFMIVCTLIAIIDLLWIHIPEKEIVATNTTAREKIDFAGTWKFARAIPGFIALIFFSVFNNLLGGIFMALMDAYGLSLVSVQTWGLLWGVLNVTFIFGGILVAKFGLGARPLHTFFVLNGLVWGACIFFTLQSWAWLFVLGALVWMLATPAIEACEQTIIQKVVPLSRQGRIIGFMQSMESAAAPLTAFLIGPLTHFFFVPFMTTGVGAQVIGSWFGTGQDRAIALVFTLAGIVGVIVTMLMKRSRATRRLSDAYENGAKEMA